MSLHRYAHRAGAHFLGLGTSKVMSVVVFILIARTLLPTGFGLYTLWLTIGILLVYFSDLGLSTWFQTEAHRQPPQRLFQQILQLRLAILSVIMFLLVGWWLGKTPFTLAVFISLMVYITAEAVITLSEGWHQYHGNVVMIALKNIGKILIIGAVFFWLRNSYSLAAAVQSTTLASVAMMLWFIPWEIFRHWRWLRLQEAVDILRKASFYSFLQLTSYAYARGDSLIVQYTLGAAALGLYGAAYRVLETVSLLPTAVMQTLFPLAAKPGQITGTHLRRLLPVMVLGGGVVALGGWLFGPMLLVALLGSAYAPAGTTLRIFSGVMWLFFINAPLAALVQSSPIVKQFLPWGIANTMVNILLNLLFVPRYGIAAAASAMLLTEFTGLLINIYFVKLRYATSS